MKPEKHSPKLARGLVLLMLAQAGYTAAVVLYTDSLQLLCAMLTLVGSIWGLAVLWHLAADYKRALVICLLVQIGLGLLSMLLGRYVVGYLVVRVGMYVGTYLQAYLVCAATAQEMGRYGQLKLAKRGRMLQKLYLLELAGRIFNLCAILMPVRVWEQYGGLLNGLLGAMLAGGNLIYLVFLWQCWQAALQEGMEPIHL